jgi:ureidoacrylate peracid hydrolase
MASLRDWIDPPRSALVIVDMQVDFAAPHGVVGRAGGDLAALPAALAAASDLARAARQAGVLVVFVGLSTTAQTDSPAWAERLRRCGKVPEEELALCRAGTPGADFYGPQPEPDDLVVLKTRYSGFYGAALDQILRGRNIDTLVICGTTTECCVDCTVRDAFHLDYQVLIAADACASYNRCVHDAALASLEMNFAMLVGSAEVILAWARTGARTGAREQA